MSSEAASRIPTPAERREMLGVVMVVPPAWIALVAAAAAFSCFSLSHPASGGWGVTFSIGTTTIAVVALIWLPALLRLLALTGVKFKAAGVEASSRGLMGPTEDLIENLTNIRTATEEAKRQAPEADETLQDVTAQIDQIAAQYVGTTDVVNDEAVTRLARHYEELRSSMEPGDERTVEMTRVVNEARVRASADQETAKRLGSLLVRSRSEGERLVGLAFLEEAPVHSAFHDVLGLITNSAAAFEMYHALLALESLAPELSRSERTEAVAVLRAEMSDPRGIGVMEDSNLPELLEETVEILEEG